MLKRCDLSLSMGAAMAVAGRAHADDIDDPIGDFIPICEAGPRGRSAGRVASAGRRRSPTGRVGRDRANYLGPARSPPPLGISAYSTSLAEASEASPIALGVCSVEDAL